MLAAAGLLIAVLLFSIPGTYRVDATLTIRSKDVLFIPAPFDGYLHNVQVDIGDMVSQGQILVRLDTRELVLEASSAEADVVRYQRESEKAQAARKLAEMEINQSRREQASAQLALVRHKLANSEVTAPRSGIVIEGELKKNVGAPVRKGDLLLKLGQLEQLYLELQFDQVDVHDITAGMRGEFALMGRPEQHFPLVIERVDPTSTMIAGKNVFLARANIQQSKPAWWRPGMGGTVKIEVGKRRLIWILTNRTVRAVREWFWI